MPVTGFPATVETALNALLTDNAVSSWKIAGEGSNTVVVLRLKPVVPLTTTMADPVLNRETRVQYFRKKPPSQVRRDQKRAQQQKRRLEQVGADNENTCEADELAFFDTELEDGSTQCTTLDATEQHTKPARIDSESDDTSEVQDDLQSLCPCQSECDTIGQEIQRSIIDTGLEQSIDRTVAGFDMAVVKDYVATLTDRGVQKRLRDKNRNVAFRKFVFHQSDDVGVLMCESDDIVVEYSCDPCSENDCVFWYVKQEHRNMSSEERVKLSHLRKGRRANNTQHAETQARALRRLHVLLGLIQFYLG